ncbi:MAG: hypothetical protein GY801_25055 [bacterium]|nr:hypothetical protein [bacterium]
MSSGEACSVNTPIYRGVSARPHPVVNRFSGFEPGKKPLKRFTNGGGNGPGHHDESWCLPAEYGLQGEIGFESNVCALKINLQKLTEEPQNFFQAKIDRFVGALFDRQ